MKKHNEQKTTQQKQPYYEEKEPYKYDFNNETTNREIKDMRQQTNPVPNPPTRNKKQRYPKIAPETANKIKTTNRRHTQKNTFLDRHHESHKEA